MWDKDHPNAKWLHVVIKIVAAIIIFKVGVLVGEFKVIKTMVLRGGAHQKMLFKGDDEGPGAGARFFTKRLLPGEKGNMMFWKGNGPAPEAGAAQPVTP